MNIEPSVTNLYISLPVLTMTSCVSQSPWNTMESFYLNVPNDIREWLLTFKIRFGLLTSNRIRMH